MKSGIQNALRLLLCLLALLALTGCAAGEDPEPTVPQWKWLREKAEYLNVIATEEDLALLEECVNLEYLNLTGSTCYDAIWDYVQRHPQVEVIYEIPLGTTLVSSEETEAALEPGTYDAASLQRHLAYLPGLTALSLPKTQLTFQELTDLQAAFPEVKISYSVGLLGKEYLTDTTTLDLSHMTPEQTGEAAAGLALLPGLEEVELMDASGSSSLTEADVALLMDALPHVRFHYTFDLFGQTLSTADERVEFEDIEIGDEGESQIRSALEILPCCTYFKLEDCGISNEVLASIREDYPEAGVVWRVSFGGQYSLMTDETTLRTVYGVENSHNDVLKYCTSLKYIDMGHNTTLTDISFASYMPDLEILILSGASIRNVDALANCKNLVFLEMANCMQLEDISALKNCEKLRFLNIGFTNVKDLTPIQDLPLERFICLGPKMDKEVRTAFEESHPDCWVRFSGKNPLSLGWKYDDIGETYSEYYKFIREIFDLDAVQRRLDRLAAEEEARREQEEASKQPAAPSNPGSGETTPPATEAPAETTPPATEAPAETAPPATEAPAPTPVPDPPAPDPVTDTPEI